MKCRWVRSRLQKYSVKTLPPNEHQQVAQHLEDCSACQKALQEWQALLDALDSPWSLEARPLPVDFTASVMQRIHQQPHTAVQPLWLRLLSQPVLTSCAAALVFVIIFSPLLSEHLELVGLGAIYHRLGTEFSLIQGALEENVLNFTSDLQEFLSRIFLGGI